MRSPGRTSVLIGRRVVVTRAAEQAEGLCRALEALGAVAVRCPTIRLAPPARWDELDGALARLAAYDWVLFTSANGVRFTLERMSDHGLGGADLPGARVGAVGSRTAKALIGFGVEPAFVAPDEGSMPLAEALLPIEGVSVLMARSDRSDPVAAEILRRRGARRVDEVVAYRTIPTAPSGGDLEDVRRGADAVTFTSPSTVQGFVLLGPEWRGLLSGAIVASLGPTTSAAARAEGMEVRVEATERTMAGLVEALARGFRDGEISS